MSLTPWGSRGLDPGKNVPPRVSSLTPVSPPVQSAEQVRALHLAQPCGSICS